jgi:hypothetical protein
MMRKEQAHVVGSESSESSANAAMALMRALILRWYLAFVALIISA